MTFEKLLFQTALSVGTMLGYPSSASTMIDQLVDAVPIVVAYCPTGDPGTPTTLPFVGDTPTHISQFVPVAEPFLNEVYQHCEAGRADDALDAIFDEVDELLDTGDTERLSLLLDTVDLTRLDIPAMLGFLSTTISIRLSLPSRKSYLEKVRNMISRSRSQEETAQLLHGLE